MRRSCIAAAGVGVAGVLGVVLTSGHVTAQSSPVDASPALRLLVAYTSNAASDVTFGSIVSFIADLNAVAAAWVDEVPASNREHRREIVAMVALETAISTPGWADDGAIIEWACEFLRHGPPTPFEREWMAASSAVQERGVVNGDTAGAQRHIGHALSRFPDDTRLRLARILMRPEAYTTSNRPGVPTSRLAKSHGRGTLASVYLTTPGSIHQTLRDLEALVRDPMVGADAGTHLGLLHFVLGETTEAVAASRAAAEGTDDPFLRNQGWLVTGLALEARGQLADATDAYRAAVRALPTAKSSAAALGVRLFLAGQRSEGSSVVDAALGADPPAFDPWRHVVGADRLVPAYLTELRRMVGRADVTVPSLASTPRRDLAPAPGQQPAAVADNRPMRVPSSSPATTFRAKADAVAVDVSVRLGRTPVTGLTPGDFEILDNGVPQTVSAIGGDIVPLDVSLVVDTSDPIMWVRGVSGASRESIQGRSAADVQEVREIVGLLRPIDRIRVLGANVQPYEIIPWQPAAVVPIGAAEFRPRWDSQFDFTSALYDATAAALVTVTPPDRRHLVIVFTDGIDGMSVVTARVLLDVAGVSDAVVHLARRYTFGEMALIRNPRSSDTDSERLLWPKDTGAIENVARATGGTVRHPEEGESMATTFKQILDDFRQSYILHYQPTGVTPGGWHQITVRVTRPGKYDVHARRGYFGGS